MRMQLEIKTKMTESRLEGLSQLIDGAVMASAEGGTPARQAVYSNEFHDDDPKPPGFATT
jgi:hypothetical protein